MTDDGLFALLDPIMKEAGSIPAEGEEFRSPPLDVLRYYRRAVKLHWVPLLGRAASVVAVARQPVDVGFSAAGYRQFLGRLAMAVNGRFPPWSWRHGLGLGLTVIALTPEPIGPDDDATLREIVSGRALPRQRAVPLGVIRLNLGQEALSFALASGPEGVFTEPAAIVDALTPHFRRFVPLIEV